MRLRGWVAVAMLVCTATAFIGAASAAADAGPFTCTTATDFISPKGQLYAMQETGGGAPTGMTALGSSPFVYNAIAFNPHDGYLYAIAEPPHSPDLLRFDQTGAVTDLGPVTGLPQLPTYTQYVTGAFGAFDASTGLMWVFADTAHQTAYAINVITDSVVQTLTLSAPLFAFDWAWHGGYMWALDNNYLYQVNLTSGQVLKQPVATGNGSLDQQFNAVWRFANGDLAFLGSTGDVLARITVAPGPLSSASNVLSLQVLSLPGASAGINDGASCAPPPQPVTLSGTSISATEGSGFTGTVASFTDPNGGEPASQYTATIDWGDGSTSAGQISGPTGGPFTVSGSHTYTEEGNYTVTVTVTNVDYSADQGVSQSAATIADAALSSSCAAPSNSAQAFSGPTATFSDGDPNGMTSDYSATIDWGDGSSSAGAISPGTGSGPYSVSGTHAYSSTGPFTITTTIDDAGGSQTVATCQTLVYGFAPGGGSFVIGDRNSGSGTHVMFWGAQWWKNNSLSGGSAPASFKGFAVSPSSPACGIAWATDPGNSAPPPSGPLPAYMAVIVSSNVTKSGAQISGNTAHIVVVRTDSGYQPDPGHAGTGTVVSQVC